MSEMVERVARAICWERRGECKRERFAGEDSDCRICDYAVQHLESARAAIEAMREPTGTMVDAVECVMIERQYKPVSVPDAWRTMIDAALKPPA